jgi:uncharacterized protein involved in exopolysaccharide biosynthesis
VSELRPAEASSHVLLTLLKWHRLILASGLVLMLAAGVAMLLKPITPFATAKVLIKTDRSAPPVAGLPNLSARYSQALLQTEAQFLKSTVVLLPVARALRAARGETDSMSPLDSTIEQLREDLAVTPILNASVMHVTNSAPLGAEAERILRMILDSYIEQNAVAHGISALLGKEADRAAANLRDAEERVLKWQEANNIVAMDSQIAARLATVGEIEGGLKRNEVEIEAVRAQIATLTHQIAALPAQAVTGRDHMENPLIARLKADVAAAEAAALSDVRKNPVIERLRIEIATTEATLGDTAANPLVAKLKGDLATAEIALHDLRQRYRDEDRRVEEKLEQVGRLQQEIAAAERGAVKQSQERLGGLRRELATGEQEVEAANRERIAGLRAQLAKAERDSVALARETVAPNPLREALNRELAAARTRLTSLVSQQDALRRQHIPATTALAEIQDKRVHFERIAREVEVAKALYLQSSNRLEDARVAAGLEKNQLSSIVVMEPPHAIEPSRSPLRIATVSLLGAMVGLGLGVATAFALEIFNRSLRTPEDVEFYLGVPVLATVPAVSGATRRGRALPPANERQTGIIERDSTEVDA